ncbi:MAG: bifunctional diaminohydroxyphosphoribosylaminopyrimidine deaminase/5-amino-6-(5-phosphoribosylamino)uracil reductase RibD [Verrucomicrobia bacterium]|nr:MAG: bifunctional diaminohydroxyphosphoribosylaminopyrimidine deaminase/5-amino-6-(5-phosphoribosylamino)uracil reductase RibD [Verrucomicrobiota bacterium]
MNASAQIQWMQRALDLARRGWGETAPNPLVGALILEDGQLVAEGWHARDGGPHAERVALAALGRRPRADATMLVTLEPCSTVGRTGACCDAILAAGITRVIIGATDPNPAHAGRGTGLLRAAGATVIEGVLAAECTDLNLIFNHWITTGRPLIAAKVATTRDGFCRPPQGAARWITGPAARADVHHWRRLFPAIAVGAGTVLSDNPALTRRWADLAGREREDCGWRFVFDATLRTAAGDLATWPRVYADAWHERTTVVTSAAADSASRARLEAAGVRVWAQETTRGARGWAEFSARCAAERISGVYLEGGAELLADASEAGAATYGFLYSNSRDAGLGWGGRVDWGFRSGVQESRFGDDTLRRGFLL